MGTNRSLLTDVLLGAELAVSVLQGRGPQPAAVSTLSNLRPESADIAAEKGVLSTRFPTLAKSRSYAISQVYRMLTMRRRHFPLQNRDLRLTERQKV